MEFGEHEEEDQDEEMEDFPPLPPPPPQQGGYGGGDGTNSAARKAVRYRECLKNHAVGIGGSAVDGCGEFMAAGEEGTLDALRCAACNCHRNFHRKEAAATSSAAAAAPLVIYHPGSGGGHQFSPYYRAAPPPPAGYLHHLTPPPHQRPLALPSTSREDLEDISNPSSSGGGGGGSGGTAMGMMAMRKRHRTKFTSEQKERMLGFAERLGWRIQKHDEAAVQQFCSDIGIKRHVLKVWMHNNKHTLVTTESRDLERDGRNGGFPPS